MTVRTHIAGDHRFDGYGNVEIDPQRHHRGWQLTCSQCGGRSEIQAHKGRSYPPKMLYRWFREKGWKLSGNPAHDVCPACVEKTREKHREERKQYVNGSADRLIEGIRLVDKLMTASVTTEYGNRQPDVAAAMKSLIETAYLCNMLSPSDIPADIRPPKQEDELERLRADNRDLQARCEQLLAERDHLMFRGFWRDDPPEHELTLDEAWDQAGDEARERFLEIIGLCHKAAKEPEPPPPPPPPPVPEPEPKPAPIHPRTAAYLAQMRRTILGEEAHK